VPESDLEEVSYKFGTEIGYKCPHGYFFEDKGYGKVTSFPEVGQEDFLKMTCHHGAIWAPKPDSMRCLRKIGSYSLYISLLILVVVAVDCDDEPHDVSFNRMMSSDWDVIERPKYFGTTVTYKYIRGY